MKQNTSDALTQGIETFLSAATDSYATVARSALELWKVGVESNPWVNQISLNPVCEIPPACWLPEDLGAVTTTICPKGSATLQICVTNCQPKASKIGVRVAATDWSVDIEPKSVEVGPMEKARFTVCITAPGDACTPHCEEAIIWIDGCKQYFARWHLALRDKGGETCDSIAVDDCPDYQHHWYDHFYCARPCNKHR